MKLNSSVRPLFSLLLLLLLTVVVILRCRFSFNNGYRFGFGFYSAKSNTTFDYPIFNSTLLELSETDPGEPQIQMESNLLLGATFQRLVFYRPLAFWRPYLLAAGSGSVSVSGSVSGSADQEQFNRIWLHSHTLLSRWSQNRRYTPDILSDLVDLVRLPIDGSRNKYSSCAVVGNSGILLDSDHGPAIDSHEAVIRLNNARIDGFASKVGSKTTISFVNSNVYQECSRRRRRLTPLDGQCPVCYPYGPTVPIVLYICQPVHFLDYASCTSSSNHTFSSSSSSSSSPSSSSSSSPTHLTAVVTDPRLDVLCSRIIKYYSLRRFFFGPSSSSSGRDRTLDKWTLAHDGQFFHYSSGMQAVLMSLGLCDKISLFGFGKLHSAKHHYYTNQKAELNLHDYQAEYDFYTDLAHTPWLVPFIHNGFHFPPLRIFLHTD